MRHGFIRRWLRVALSAASICLVAVTSLIGGGGPASAQNWVCQGATTQNRHCYAQTIWGVTGASGGGTPVSFSEIGADLEIDCLSIGNLSTDFINYEMWMYTNTNFQHPMATWVEGGYARGGSAIGNLPSLSVFRFWADQRSTTGLDYAEHFIGNATPGQYIDTGFQWVPNTGNWRVYSNHTQVGTSVNVGAWAGGADLGLEFTDTQSAGVGNATNWRYKTGVNGVFRAAPVGWAFINPPGAGTATSTGATQHSNTANNCAYPLQAQARTAPPRTVNETQALTEVAPEFAKSFGDTTPTTSKAVATTRAAANKAQNADVAGNEAVVMLEMTGEFDAGNRIRAPHGADVPNQKGTVLTAVIDQATGQLLDWRLSSGAPAALASLGHVVQK